MYKKNEPFGSFNFLCLGLLTYTPFCRGLPSCEGRALSSRGRGIVTAHGRGLLKRYPLELFFLLSGFIILQVLGFVKSFLPVDYSVRLGGVFVVEPSTR